MCMGSPGCLAVTHRIVMKGKTSKCKNCNQIKRHPNENRTMRMLLVVLCWNDQLCEKIHKWAIVKLIAYSSTWRNIQFFLFWNVSSCSVTSDAMVFTSFLIKRCSWIDMCQMTVSLRIRAPSSKAKENCDGIVTIRDKHIPYKIKYLKITLRADHHA